MENNNLYPKVYDFTNLVLAWKKARKHKTKKDYVVEFEKSLCFNLIRLHCELKNQTYSPQPLKTFILRDPKTRKISKAHFRDKIVHHAICNVINPIFEKSFIYDSCANQIGKGNLFALNRFDLFKRRVTNNLKSKAFCLKADIKHYFQEVSHEILRNIIRRKIKDKNLINLITLILNNGQNKIGFGMPLGNLTSQFLANVYLNELDYFIKHKLKVKYYVRYVDDFVILSKSEEQLLKWKESIANFLKEKLGLGLHPDKSKIILLSRGIDFVGFRDFYYFKLLRRRNIKKMFGKIEQYKKGEINQEKILESFQGWNAYAK